MYPHNWSIVTRAHVPRQVLPMFSRLGQEVLTRLCRCVISLTTIKGQRVIEAGKVGSEMYFLLTGECEVLDKHGAGLH